ncbi:MAG TPA: hypothetical protein VNQ48_00530 [Microbacteriaceae bacterium]|nr:hypothetical protein [Microbacteriaceae bacterium]
MPSALSWFSGLLGLVTGVIIGVLFTIAHRAHTVLLGVDVPVGFVLGLVAVASLLVGLRLLSPDRLAAIGAGVGVVGAIMVLAARGDAGAVLVAADPLGVAWLLVPSVIAAIAIVWPRARHPRRA